MEMHHLRLFKDGQSQLVSDVEKEQTIVPALRAATGYGT